MNKTMTAFTSKATAALCALTLAAGTTGILTDNAFAATYVGSSNAASPDKSTARLGEATPNTLASHTNDALYIQTLDNGYSMRSLDAVTLYGAAYEVAAPQDGESAWTLVAPEGTQPVNPTTGEELNITGIAVFGLANDEGTESIIIALPKEDLPADSNDGALSFAFTVKAPDGSESNVVVDIDSTEVATPVETDEPLGKAAEALPDKETPVVIIDEQDGKAPVKIADVEKYTADEPASTVKAVDDSSVTKTVYSGSNATDTTVTATVTSEDDGFNDVIQAVSVSGADGTTDVTTTVDTEVTENANGNVTVTEDVTTTIDTNSNANANEGRTLAQTSDSTELGFVAAVFGVATLAAGVAMVATRKQDEAE